MRLYNTIFVCKAYRPGLNVQIQKSSEGLYDLMGWNTCKEALLGLKQIKFLEKYIEKAYDALPQMEREKPGPNIRISEQPKLKFEKEINTIKIAVDATIGLYDSLEIEGTSNGLDIRMPQCNSLEDYIEILGDINFILTQYPYITKAKERIVFKNVDVGSQWITFVVIGGAGYAILSAIASLVHKALDLQSHIKMLRTQELFLEEEKAKTAITQDTVSVFQRYKKMVIDEAIASVEKENGDLADGEERDKVGRSIELMAQLIDKGVMVYSSIDVPKDTKALFPMNEENAILPDNIVKMIEEKKQ